MYQNVIARNMCAIINCKDSYILGRGTLLCIVTRLSISQSEKNMKKIGYDILKFDALQIVEDTKCCLKVNAVITKEGVYQYPDGKALKCRTELLSATHTARNAKLTILNHPESLVIMSQKQIHGVIEKPFFDRNRIRAQLNFDKSVCPKDFVDSVRVGTASKDVSIGFYYSPDMTPGMWSDEQGIKHPYDYIMRDIVIDHVAVGVVKGRCSYPDCGIGVDAMMQQIGLDPFGEYKDFADCVAKNKDKSDPEAYCAAIKRKIEGSTQKLGGKKELSEKEYEEFKKDHMAHGYTEQQAKDYWDSYVIGVKEPLVEEKKPEEVKPEDKKEEKPAETPEDKKGEQPKQETLPPPPPPEDLSAEQLIDRSKELLAMREQKVIEEQRKDRRNPM